MTPPDDRPPMVFPSIGHLHCPGKRDVNMPMFEPIGESFTTPRAFVQTYRCSRCREEILVATAPKA